MPLRTPFQFKILIKFHFAEHDANRRRWFSVGENCERRVPLELQEIEGLHTVLMRFEKPERFVSGDEVTAKCIIISPQLFVGKIAPGAKGKLWDAGFFADVEVMEVNKLALQETAKRERRYGV